MEEHHPHANHQANGHAQQFAGADLSEKLKAKLRRANKYPNSVSSSHGL